MGLTNKRQKQTRKNTITKKTSLKGGLIYGKPGSYGITLGDPPLPSKDIRNTYSKMSGKLTIQGKSKRGKSVAVNSSNPNSNSTANPNNAELDENSYVSKIFFDENNIRMALKAIDYIKSAISGSNNQTVEQLFGAYLLLPRRWQNGKYYISIDRIKYMKSKFQSDEYWKFNNPKSPGEGGPQIELREKFKGARKQIQYLKAVGGDLDGVRANSIESFKDFMMKYQNIVKGIDLLHSHGLVHHDIKLGNMLSVQMGAETKYLISDLDTIRQFDYFTNENYNKLQQNDDSFDFDRLFLNWAYEYFPTYITLLAPVLLSEDDVSHNSAYADNLLSIGIVDEWNVAAASSCQIWFNELYKKLHKILPADKNSTLSDIRLIFLHKYGNDKLNGDFKAKDERQYKLNNMMRTNRYISDRLNNSGLTLIEMRNILLKYVDIYGATISILRKLFEFTKDFAGPYTPEIIDYLINIIQVVKSILTAEYFGNKLYEQTFSNLYEQILPK